MQKFTAQLVETTGGTLSDDAPQVIEAAETGARRLLDSNVKLLEIPGSEKRACEALRASPAGKMQAGDGKFVGIFIDPAQMGEPITAPHIRNAPLDQTTVKAPTAVLSVRAQAWLRQLGRGMKLGARSAANR